MRPLAYHVRAQCITLGSDSDPIEFGTAANTWTTKNAVTLLGSMFKKQLRDNNIRVGQLPKYGRELRLSLTTDTGYSHTAGSDGFGQMAYLNSPMLAPVNAAGSAVMANYTNSDGATVSFGYGNELSTISVPETTADGEPEVVVPSLLGTTNHGENHLAVVPEYLNGRRNTHDHVEKDSDFPSDDNILYRIGSGSDEHYDDVVEAVEDVGDMRPYDEAGANAIVTQGILASAGDYCSFVAPLGLTLQCTFQGAKRPLKSFVENHQGLVRPRAPKPPLVGLVTLPASGSRPDFLDDATEYVGNGGVEPLTDLSAASP
eukprot:gene13645-biopygen12524